MYQPPPFHPKRPTLVAPVRMDPSGAHGPTRAQVRGRRWRTSSHGLYVPAATSLEEPRQRSVEAAGLLRLQEAVTGWASLSWLTARWFTGTRADGSLLPVPLLTHREVEAPEWVTISQEHLRGGERMIVDGLPVTDPVRSVSFEARHADDLWSAVIALDMACYSDLASLAEVAAYAAVIGPWTGIGQLRKAISLGDENSWSPREVQMRLVWEVLAERPRPRCNVPVFDRAGRHVGTPDLIDPVAGVIGEYEGALHLAGAQRAHDVRREGEFRQLGLEVVTMVSADGTDGFAAFLGRLHSAYADARYAAEPDRAWTIQPPAWWVDTSSVAARRALDPRTSTRVLRYRRAA